MTELEKQNTLRVLGKRNKQRRAVPHIFCRFLDFLAWKGIEDRSVWDAATRQIKTLEHIPCLKWGTYQAICHHLNMTATRSCCKLSKRCCASMGNFTCWDTRSSNHQAFRHPFMVKVDLLPPGLQSWEKQRQTMRPAADYAWHNYMRWIDLNMDNIIIYTYMYLVDVVQEYSHNDSQIYAHIFKYIIYTYD